MKTYDRLAIPQLDDFLFGSCPHPVTLPNGMVIGGGKVIPELNFTLPEMIIRPETLPEVRRQYSEMIQSACTRLAELHAPALVVEFELLPDQTITPEWGAEVTAILHETLARTQAETGILTALRVTPNDIREFERPPLLRSGKYVDSMFRSFDLCAKAGADLLSIESTGGKEIHDDAILKGDLAMSVFSLGVLACRDMAYLWDRITEIAFQNNVVSAGDTACGFANTAMVLAEQHFIPRVWAALIRVLTVPRSLTAYEHGAIGPGKDCAYENPYIKAITGCPVSMEGAEAACAHLSPVGNIAKAVPDLWSNESVQNIKLLGGMAPTISLEQLVYATRLMNTSLSHGPDAARTLRDWWVESDAPLDPQAYVLRPEVVLPISQEIVAESNPYLRTRRAALAALEQLRHGAAAGSFELTRVEQRWLDRLSRQADELPEDEEAFIAQMVPQLDLSKIRLDEYQLAAPAA